jgi:hypothetical protein
MGRRRTFANPKHRLQGIRSAVTRRARRLSTALVDRLIDKQQATPKITLATRFDARLWR